MNKKFMKIKLKNKLDKWIDSIDNSRLKTLIKRDAIVTGGAIVSLLNNEEPNDYDVYFKTKETTIAVAQHYAEIFGRGKDRVITVKLQDEKVSLFIKSNGILDDVDYDSDDEQIIDSLDEKQDVKNKKEKKVFYPKFMSSNAITLSDDIQIVIRFYGDVETIHANYDFVHTTCSYDYELDEVNTPERALLAIVNKELIYQGSKYPLASLVRIRKFIKRGWHVNAGQFVKIAFQLNDINLKDFNTFKDQLTGVDSYYFSRMIKDLEEYFEGKPESEQVLDSGYLYDLINKYF